MAVSNVYLFCEMWSTSHRSHHLRQPRLFVSANSNNLRCLASTLFLLTKNMSKASRGKKSPGANIRWPRCAYLGVHLLELSCHPADWYEARYRSSSNESFRHCCSTEPVSATSLRFFCTPRLQTAGSSFRAHRRLASGLRKERGTQTTHGPPPYIASMSRCYVTFPPSTDAHQPTVATPHECVAGAASDTYLYWLGRVGSRVSRRPRAGEGCRCRVVRRRPPS